MYFWTDSIFGNSSTPAHNHFFGHRLAEAYEKAIGNGTGGESARSKAEFLVVSQDPETPPGAH
jgi:hypothetical protein